MCLQICGPADHNSMPIVTIWQDFEDMESDFLAMERDGIPSGFGQVSDLDAGYLPVG